LIKKKSRDAPDIVFAGYPAGRIPDFKKDRTIRPDIRCIPIKKRFENNIFYSANFDPKI
jgi:hypothetical protein